MKNLVTLFAYFLISLGTFQTSKACYKDVRQRILTHSQAAFDNHPYKRNLGVGILEESGERFSVLMLDEKFALAPLHVASSLQPGVKKGFITTSLSGVLLSSSTTEFNGQQTIDYLRAHNPGEVSEFKVHHLSEYTLRNPSAILSITIPTTKKDLEKNYSAILKKITDKIEERRDQSTKEYMLSPEFLSQGLSCLNGTKSLYTDLDLVLLELETPLKSVPHLPLHDLLPPEDENSFDALLIAFSPSQFKDNKGKLYNAAKVVPVTPDLIRVPFAPIAVNLQVTKELGGKKIIGEFLSPGGESEKLSLECYAEGGSQERSSKNPLAGSGMGGFSGAPLFAQSQKTGKWVLLGFYSQQINQNIEEMKTPLLQVTKAFYALDPTIGTQFFNAINQQYIPLVDQDRLGETLVEQLLTILDCFEGFRPYLQERLFQRKFSIYLDQFISSNLHESFTINQEGLKKADIILKKMKLIERAIKRFKLKKLKSKEQEK